MMNDNNGSAGYEQRVNHIRCEVDECVYNNRQKCCTASMIEVDSGSGSCDSFGDTCCRTFKKN